jgi:hypothetical protein
MVQKEEPTMLKSVTRNRARRHVVTQAVAILEIADRHAIDLIAAIERAEKAARRRSARAWPTMFASSSMPESRRRGWSDYSGCKMRGAVAGPRHRLRPPPCISAPPEWAERPAISAR